mmetsp:Transcript_16334/g.41744  ORF Transcript_16334/g.41744 Transcript_16334/m.41744 type:complete len:400 (-) Transcript_16334:458-1657(-)
MWKCSRLTAAATRRARLHHERRTEANASSCAQWIHGHEQHERKPNDKAVQRQEPARLQRSGRHGHAVDCKINLQPRRSIRCALERTVHPHPWTQETDPGVSRELHDRRGPVGESDNQNHPRKNQQMDTANPIGGVLNFLVQRRDPHGKPRDEDKRGVHGPEQIPQRRTVAVGRRQRRGRLGAPEDPHPECANAAKIDQQEDCVCHHTGLEASPQIAKLEAAALQAAFIASVDSSGIHSRRHPLQVEHDVSRELQQAPPKQNRANRIKKPRQRDGHSHRLVAGVEHPDAQGLAFQNNVHPQQQKRPQRQRQSAAGAKAEAAPDPIRTDSASPLLEIENENDQKRAADHHVGEQHNSSYSETLLLPSSCLHHRRDIHVRGRPPRRLDQHVVPPAGHVLQSQ